jgi:hypothetical protein
MVRATSATMALYTLDSGERSQGPRVRSSITQNRTYQAEDEFWILVGTRRLSALTGLTPKWKLRSIVS